MGDRAAGGVGLPVAPLWWAGSTTRGADTSKRVRNRDDAQTGGGPVDFERYVAERGRALERYAYVLTGDAHLAQDLTQTALLRAYRRWRRVVRADQPDLYVRRILTNVWIDHSRRRSSSERPVAEVVDVVAGNDPAERVVALDELRRALTGLTPGQRAVLTLRHLEGYDDETVA